MHRACDHGVGGLSAGALSFLCDEGRTLAEIAALAGTSRQAVHARINGTALDAARRMAKAKLRKAAHFSRWRRGTVIGPRLLTAAAEIREHCANLRIEWRWHGTANMHSWQLLVDGLPLSVYAALSVSRVGQPGYYRRVYRAELKRPDIDYLVRTGDQRRFLYLAPPVPRYVWFEACAPWRRSRTLTADYEWRAAGAGSAG